MEICQRNNATIFLDDMDFYYNKVKCKKIERMLPELSKMVVAESIHLS